MTSSPRWYRFFPTDWLSRIGDLSSVERGVLLTLVCLMFERGDRLPRDDARLARLCGMTPASFRKALNALIHEGKVTETDGLLSTEWVAVELANTFQKANSASRSAKARWDKKPNENNDATDATASPTHPERICEPDATQNQKETPIGPKGRNGLIDLTGMSREIQTYTSLGINREAALGVECHRCGATPNAPCVGTDGAQRARSHIQRYQLVAHHRNVPTASTGGELPVIREDDPIAPFLAKVRGKPIYWGTRSCTTATPAEMDAARALAGAA
ncbi:DUF1376 domain-containing protein [Devosia sp. J2-20]|uniref:DUF1376 domain-containing protein n=1 Tax=Devosia sp. J2-20 TaxID=3026161 RepID=UPI00249A4221|nr:DUF1376 domain-containing protein [Devosia sp. J2-20]WDR00884.1 DUF1376 domain-containing protein [Devosia sp. J2-20]